MHIPLTISSMSQILFFLYVCQKNTYFSSKHQLKYQLFKVSIFRLKHYLLYITLVDSEPVINPMIVPIILYYEYLSKLAM